MKCQVCGNPLEATVTDMPFKTGMRTIVILKGLPVLLCGNCGEYLLEDPVLEKTESILEHVDQNVELEIVQYAA